MAFVVREIHIFRNNKSILNIRNISIELIDVFKKYNSAYFVGTQKSRLKESQIKTLRSDIFGLVELLLDSPSFKMLPTLSSWTDYIFSLLPTILQRFLRYKMLF